jgi:peptide deformylase
VTIRRIVTIGDPILTTPCKPVTDFGPELQALIRDMRETMYAAPGVGLAANQIGVDLALAVIDLTVGEEEGRFFVIANPRITAAEGEQEEEEEGCLSIPDLTEAIVRPAKVTVVAQDEHGTERTIVGEGLMARALCHEIGHLNGRFYIDELKGLKKTLAYRKARKTAKEG